MQCESKMAAMDAAMKESSYNAVVNASGYDRPSLRDLHNHVIPAVASKWRDLGVQLLNPSTSDNILEIIKENHPQDVMGCCKYMLQKWLDTIPDASWNQLLEALRSPCVQLNFLADQVECKLIKKSDFIIPTIHDEKSSIKLKNFKKLEIEFAKMTERIKEVLRNNNVSVISLLEQLCTISAIKIKKVPLFDEDVFEKIETIDELWRKLRKYWDIFDYDILIFVVELTECTEAQEIFNSFLARIDPSAFEDMDLVLHCKVYQEEELMRPFLRIKVNAEMCTFDIKRQVKEIVSKKFNLEKYSLRLNSIKDGCIEFTFNISKAVMSYVLEYHITGNIIANFARYNIISPQVNEMTLNIPSEIVDMDKAFLWSKELLEPTEDMDASDLMMWFTGFVKEKYIHMKQEMKKSYWLPVELGLCTSKALFYQRNRKDEMTKEAAGQINLYTNNDISRWFAQIDSASHELLKGILIEGNPKIGKTTFVKKLCIEWTEGKLLTSSKLVLLLSVSIIQKVTSMHQLLEHFLTSPSQAKKLCEYFEDTKGANITLIIDGFNELNKDVLTRSFYSELIKGSVLPKATIVLTSQYSTPYIIHNDFDVMIRILGIEYFSDSCAINVLKDSPSKLDNLHKHLQQYPHINAMCCTPVIMSMMLFMCVHRLNNLSTTTSKFYANFIDCVMVYTLKRSEKNTGIVSINTVDYLTNETAHTVLQQLQKLAFQGCISDKTLFTFEELPDMCKDDLNCYGLLEFTSADNSDNLDWSFTFLHHGIQEYLAAKYISDLPDDKVYELLARSFLLVDNTGCYDDCTTNNIHLFNMWIMYCGIAREKSNHEVPTVIHNFLSVLIQVCNYSPESFNKIKQLLPPVTSIPNLARYTSIIKESKVLVGSKNDEDELELLIQPLQTFYLFQCFQEAQDYKMCKALSLSLYRNIYLTDIQLFPHQIASMAFFLSKLTVRKWEGLYLHGCSIDDYGVYILHQYLCGTKTRKYEIKTIHLSNNNLTEASSSFIGDIISYLQPHWLKLSWNKVTKLEDISSAVTATTTIKVLEMENNDIMAQEAVAISDMITSLEELNINHNKLDDDGAVLLSNGISITKSLRVLHINNNNIGPAGCAALSGALIKNTSLEEIHMNNNSVSEDGATVIATTIAHNKTLKQLYIDNNNIGCSGAVSFASILTNNSSMQVLHICSNAIGENGAVAFAKHIADNKTLMELHINNNDIGPLGATAIADALASNATLEILYMNHNSIGRDGAKALAAAIECNKSVKELSLSFDRTMDVEAALMIVSSMYHNSAITGLDIYSNLYSTSEVREVVNKVNYSRREMNIQELFFCEDGF